MENIPTNATSNETITTTNETKPMIPYAVETLPAFWDDVHSGCAAACVSTGFGGLDEIMGGGIRAGMYGLMAPPGTGKTTAILQVASNIANSGQDVIVFSGEMAERDLHAKNLSRLSYQLGVHCPSMTATEIMSLPTRDDAETVEKLLRATYQPIAEKLVIVPPERINYETAVFDIVRAHIAATGNVPVVFVDYLQLIATKFSDLSERQSVDKFLAQLKELSSSCNVPVFLISSVNRNSYKEELSLASAKESGGIEYTADMILGMDYRDSKNKGYEYYCAHRDEARELKIQVLKNRMGAWGKINLLMHAAHNYFEEEPVFPYGADKPRSVY